MVQQQRGYAVSSGCGRLSDGRFVTCRLAGCVYARVCVWLFQQFLQVLHDGLILLEVTTRVCVFMCVCIHVCGLSQFMCVFMCVPCVYMCVHVCMYTHVCTQCTQTPTNRHIDNTPPLLTS